MSGGGRGVKCQPGRERDGVIVFMNVFVCMCVCVRTVFVFENTYMVIMWMPRRFFNFFFKKRWLYVFSGLCIPFKLTICTARQVFSVCKSSSGGNTVCLYSVLPVMWAQKLRVWHWVPFTLAREVEGAFVRKARSNFKNLYFVARRTLQCWCVKIVWRCKTIKLKKDL